MDEENKLDEFIESVERDPDLLPEYRRDYIEAKKVKALEEIARAVFRLALSVDSQEQP